MPIEMACGEVDLTDKTFIGYSKFCWEVCFVKYKDKWNESNFYYNKKIGTLGFIKDLLILD